jgi:peptide deformylase
MYRRAVTWPSKSLEARSDEIQVDALSIADLVTDLEDTLRVEGGTSLSAPQIGFGVRAFIINCAAVGQTNPDPSDCTKSLTTWFAYNPRIVSSEGSAESTEVCASLPYSSAKVTRSHTIELEYKNADGHIKSAVFEPPMSLVVQHEIDHLDGLLYTSRISNLKASMIKRAINKRRQEIRELRESLDSMDTPKITRVSKSAHLSKDEVRRRKKMRVKSRS